MTPAVVKTDRVERSATARTSARRSANTWLTVSSMVFRFVFKLKCDELVEQQWERKVTARG